MWTVLDLSGEASAFTFPSRPLQLRNLEFRCPAVDSSEHSQRFAEKSDAYILIGPGGTSRSVSRSEEPMTVSGSEDLSSVSQSEDREKLRPTPRPESWLTGTPSGNLADRDSR